MPGANSSNATSPTSGAASPSKRSSSPGPSTPEPSPRSKPPSTRAAPAATSTSTSRSPPTPSSTSNSPAPSASFAPDCWLWADANGGYDTATALEVTPKLKDAGVNVLEQPVPSNRLSGFYAVRKLGALPILLDEGVVSTVDLEEFHKLGLLDGVAMKPARTAGLYEARRQCDYLERNKLMFLGSGLTDPDVSLAASLVLYGAYALKYPAALNGLQFLNGSFLTEPFRLEDGALRVPTGPGLGVTVDEDKVRKASMEFEK